MEGEFRSEPGGALVYRAVARSRPEIGGSHLDHGTYDRFALAAHRLALTPASGARGRALVRGAKGGR
ncbi:hypothetical protein Ssi03_29910 [Sphaerisporangium siamense]|nr:hypothetical protein Ssi03_29910 [Sphaerisporangium siamense]